jgi:tetratricopeptide (TPR) repeat protein
MFVELEAPWHLYDGAVGRPETLERVLLPRASGALPLLLEGAEPPPAALLGELGIAYLGLRDHVPAADAIRVELDRRGDAAYLALFDAERIKLVGGGSTRDAHRLLDEAVRGAPRDYAPRYHRAWMLDYLGRPAEALRDLEEALALRGDQLLARYVRMRALAAVGREPEAARECDALAASPLAEMELGLYADAAFFAARAGDLPRAIRHLERFLELEPYSPDEWDTLAAWLESEGQAERAADARANVDLARANQVRRLHWIARWHERFGIEDDAILALEAALEIEPEDAALLADLERLEKP